MGVEAFRELLILCWKRIENIKWSEKVTNKKVMEYIYIYRREEDIYSIQHILQSASGYSSKRKT